MVGIIKQFIRLQFIIRVWYLMLLFNIIRVWLKKLASDGWYNKIVQMYKKRMKTEYNLDQQCTDQQCTDLP